MRREENPPLKGLPATEASSSSQVSQAGDNEGGGATAPPLNAQLFSVFYPSPLPNIALSLRVHCSASQA